MDSKKPNLFIIGAPKCGTTSLANWLRKHPDAFISTAKEPHYFNKDEYQSISRLNEYENFFKGAKNEKWVGEASTWYMYSKVAVNNILEYSTNPKFIVCLRNPVEMCQSLFYQHVQNGDEYIANFETAWALQEERAKGNHIKKSCRYPDRLQYGKVCKIGSQLKRVLKLVPANQLLILFLDDIKHNSQKVQNDVIHFLDIEPIKIALQKSNPSQIAKSKILGRFMNILYLLKNKSPVYFHTGIYGFIKKVNSKKINPKYDTAIKQELIEYFQSDIKKIEELTGRNLEHWLR